MLYIGIDFSISSPAYCISDESDIVKIGSLTRSDRTRESLTKNPKKPYHWLSTDLEGFCDLMFLERKSLPSEYSERERVKIDYFTDIVETFWESISSNINGREAKVAMEGLSFSSNGNALIDISMATALLRRKIVDSVGNENFFVFSPTSIKKFAFKGNAKKNELYESFCSVELPGKNTIKIKESLLNNKEEWVTPKGAVNKPIDDLIDSFWISIYLKSLLNE